MILEEGLAKIRIPEEILEKGPGTRKVGFYNPDQVLNRDLTIALISALHPKNYLDGFGGTGVRGIRVLRETGIEATVAEVNRKSAELIRENKELNGVELDVLQRPFEAVVSESTFDFVDVDPYGSIVPYLDTAISHVKNGGYLGLTATDLSALTGSAPEKTRRRYDAYVVTDRLKHESGIRLLYSYVAKRAAALNMEMTPIVSFWRSHYYRIIVRIRHGAHVADRALRNIGWVNKRKMLSELYTDRPEGPMWIGNLVDPQLVNEACDHRVKGVMDSSYEFLKHLPLEDERKYFFELADFGSYMKRSLPPMEKLINGIADESGIGAYRTHFSLTGIKAGISGEVFRNVFDGLSQ